MSKRSVTLIGSFRKGSASLASIFGVLSKEFNLLSPKSIDFVDNTVSFVKAGHEQNDSIGVIEERVLEAIRKSDFVWLYAPSGYIGVSAAFEMGFAHSIGVPVFTDTVPEDDMLQTMVTKVVKDPSALRLKLGGQTT